MSQHDSFEPQDIEPPATPLDHPPSTGEYLHVAKLTGLIAGLVLAIYLAYRMVTATLDVFMIGFLGILFAIFLTFLSRRLGKYTGLNYRKNLTIICVWLLAAVVGFTVFFGATLYEHVQKGVEQFQAGGTEIIATADKYPPLRAVIDASPFLQSFRDDARDSHSGGASEGSGQHGSTPGASGNAGANSGAADSGGQNNARDQQPQQASGGQESGGQESGDQASGVADMAMTVTREVGAFAGRFFVTTFGLLANLALIVIVGLYLAASPRAYMHAPTYLFPPHVRPDVQRILGISGETLWRWLLGRFFSMTVSGVGAGLLLYLFDVPSALIIGILTFMLAFIPNLGPLLAMGIAVFFALPQGLMSVAIVLGVLSFFELLESYLVAPLVTEHQVSLPPALVIFFQALMGISLGFIGLTIAAPLLAVVGVLFKEVYRKKLLKESDVDDRPWNELGDN